MSEKILILRPFAYMKLFDAFNKAPITIQTKTKELEAKKLFWRIYWVGLL